MTRIVTIKAEGTPAMLLPPQQFAAIDGLALYPAQPSLQDKTDGRTDVLTSMRVDSATYMLQRPGDYLLPAIDVGWWNVSAGKVELAHLDAVPLQVAADPAAQGALPAGTTGVRWNRDAMIDAIADHWLLALLVLAALGVIGWFAPAAARTIAVWQRRRREAYQQSEAWSFRRLRRAAGSGDARIVYFAMLDWLQRFEPVAPDHTIHALKSAAGNAALDSEIGSIERQLFASAARRRQLVAAPVAAAGQGRAAQPAQASDRHRRNTTIAATTQSRWRSGIAGPGPATAGQMKAWNNSPSRFAVTPSRHFAADVSPQTPGTTPGTPDWPSHPC